MEKVICRLHTYMYIVGILFFNQNIEYIHAFTIHIYVYLFCLSQKDCFCLWWANSVIGNDMLHNVKKLFKRWWKLFHGKLHNSVSTILSFQIFLIDVVNLHELLKNQWTKLQSNANSNEIAFIIVCKFGFKIIIRKSSQVKS